eukprot:2384494-Rhodomonas_salina.1
MENELNQKELPPDVKILNPVPCTGRGVQFMNCATEDGMKDGGMKDCSGQSCELLGGRERKSEGQMRERGGREEERGGRGRGGG